MFAGGIGIELARTWENEINNWGTCESPLKFGGVGWPCHDLPYLPRTPREPIMPSRVKSHQLACHLPDEYIYTDLITKFHVIVHSITRDITLQCYWH